MPRCAAPEGSSAQPGSARRAWTRVWPRPRTTAAALACALPLLASAAAPESAKPGADSLAPREAASPVPAGGQRLIVEIHLNGVRQGEFTVMATADGDFLVEAPDLQAMGVQPPYGAAVQVEGQAHFSLRALRAGELRFDEARLALHVTLPPERLPKKTLDLQAGQPQHVIEPHDDSAFFNYRAQYAGGTGAAGGSLALSTELGVRRGDFLLRAESLHARGSGGNQDIRYATSVTHDDRRTLRRWTVGDLSAASGELGGVVNLGGLSFSQAYQINPYFIRQPMASFTGNIASPAQAEIYLDGVRVRTETLQPGQFELRNLNYYGGQREVSVVLRDRFGREQTLVHPFYFTDANLREGLHDYSYNLGFQRRNLGVASNDYGPLALSAFHRYGLSDRLTLGGRAEAEPGRFNLGATAAWRGDTLGVVSGSLAAGRGAAGGGWAGVVRHAYQARAFSGQLEVRRTSAHYETLGQAAAADQPKKELSASASQGFAAIGTLSLDWRQLRQHRGEDQRSVSLGYSRTLFGALSVLASVRRAAGTASSAASTSLLLALTYSPQRDVTTHFFHNRRAQGGSDVLQLGSNTPVGQGLGWRVVGERASDGPGNGYRFAPSLQYNGAHGVYTADLAASRSAGGAAQQAYQLGVGGGLAYVGGALAFSRPVTDSFGIVRVGALPGVRVYHSGQEIGRTDADGQVFLPNLGSYQANRVAIDDRDIPIEYALAEKALTLSPPLRSGSVIRFDVARIQAITGRLVLRGAGGPAQPVEYVNLRVMADGREMGVPTGRGGEFYLENLQPGRHAARFVFGARHCAFELVVPASPDMLIDLGELYACPSSP